MKGSTAQQHKAKGLRVETEKTASKAEWSLITGSTVTITLRTETSALCRDSASLLSKSGILFLSLSVTALPSPPSKLALKLTFSNSIFDQ